jgi:hypothetical protein
VVVLNPLRFAEDGRELYLQYTGESGARVAFRFGVEVVYAGDGSEAVIAEPGQQWDAVLLVRCPSGMLSPLW